MCKIDWQRKFQDPIPVPHGPKLITLWDAAGYITTLPRDDQQLPHWRLAIEALINSAEGGELVPQARIGMLRALNAGSPDPSQITGHEGAKIEGRDASRT